MQEELFAEGQSIGSEVGALEQWCDERDIRWIVGVDEAGRGPLAGPVHAGAVALRTDALERSWVGRLDDSKELDEATRETLFDEIRTSAPAVAIASVPSNRIDRVNILEAAREGMLAAALEVCDRVEPAVDWLFVDGNTPLEFQGSQRTLVGGDGRSYAIAAASILAKVSRDRLMEEYDGRWPAYAFASNKGYPTPQHRRALEERGPCEIHRRSFSGVDSLAK